MAIIKITDVLYDGKIYPREKPSTAIIKEYVDAIKGGAKFPPIILESGTNRLLDGYHRWKAYASVDSINEIECDYHIIPDSIAPKLYALSLSSKHGIRPKNKEKELAAQDQYKQYPGTAIKTIARLAGVSEPTAKKYIEAMIAEFEETKRSVIMRLNMLGWTQQEISDKLQELWPDAKGTSQPVINEFLSENEDFSFQIKTDLAKGHEPKTIAQRYNLPEILVWAIKLQDKADQERMEELDIKIQPYDYWSFQGCDALYGTDYPGRIPGQLVAHVLYFFTKSDAVILDPMAGSGTVPDVCLALGRKCYAYDLENRLDRPDVLKHDMVDGWPERIKKADMIFWDPPYYEKMDKKTVGEGGYIEGSISNLGRNEYLSFFNRRLTEARKLIKKGTRLAFLMSDWDDPEDSERGIFIWFYANAIQGAGWDLVKHIQVPLSTQQVHADIVEKFRNAKRLARLERYLLIAEA